MAKSENLLPGITCRGLTKVYGSLVAVDDFNLQIEAGELIVLVGPSGCGKTTTLRMIAGFVQPSAGTILIGGKNITHQRPRARNIGMVFQDYALFPSMTVGQNIAFGLQERGVTRLETASRVDEMLALIRMERMKDRLPRELSGGQQQRVALARALAYHPAVLLMDEPLGALDQQLREDMQREIVEIQKRLGITTVFVTHDQQEAMALADRIVIMNGGKVEQIGDANEVYDSPNSLFAASFIGRSNKLHGRVAAVEPRQIRVALRNGDEIIARSGGSGFALGQEVSCILRPEDIHLHEPRAGFNNLPVTLERTSRLGGFIDVIARTKTGDDLIIQVPARSAGKIDLANQATASFAPDRAIAFPKP